MCGIFFVQNFISNDSQGQGKGTKQYKKNLLENLKLYQSDFSKLSHRGPDNSFFLNDTVDNYSKNYACFWGFHRLAINGQTPESNQPFFIKNCRLICNGEIYNFRKLITEFQFESEYKSQSDCEIIIHLYKKIGMRDMLRRLDGVFAFVLHDYDTNTTDVARDPVGVRSLFISGYDNNYSNSMIISSELKGINECYRPNAKQFPPGCYAIYNKSDFDNVNTPFLNFYSYYENVSITQDTATGEMPHLHELLHDDGPDARQGETTAHRSSRAFTPSKLSDAPLIRWMNTSSRPGSDRCTRMPEPSTWPRSARSSACASVPLTCTVLPNGTTIVTAGSFLN